MEAIPDIPTDVEREVLLRVPYELHDKFKTVCRSWETTIDSPEFYKDRKKFGKSQHLICISQTLPSIPSSNPIPNTGITVYDPVNGRWERMPPIPNFPRFPSNCELLSVNGKLVLLGGCSIPELMPMKTVFIYEFESRKWRQGADMPTSRFAFACSVSSSKDVIYVAGGCDEHGNILATAEVYDVEADNWEILPRMTQNRKKALGVFMEGKFMVISGLTNADVQLSSAEVLDTKTNTWNTPLEEMWSLESMDIQYCVSTCLGDYLYVIDWFNGVMRNYNPHDNVWKSLPFYPEDISVISCVAPWRDRIFVSGTDAGNRYTVSYLFQPSTGESTAIDTGGGIAGYINEHAATVQI